MDRVLGLNKISVITATYNVVDVLPNLIENLRSQTETDFEWVVADGGSSDGTMDILADIDDLNLVVSSQPDFGIYDALNRAIMLSSGDYYLVLGADDIIFDNAIRDFSLAASDGGYDMVTAKIIFGSKIVCPTGGSMLLQRHNTFLTGHAVGTIFKKDLHETYGYYSNKFPIAADLHFMLSALKDGATVKEIDALVGEFSLGGVSTTDALGYLTETMRVQMQFESKPLIVLIYILKILKNYRKL